MARKLHGAALAAHERKVARQRGGRKRKSSGRRASKALVRHVHHHPAVRRRARRRGAMGSVTSAGVLIPVAALAAAFGYASENVDGFADTLRKVPGVKTFGAPLVIGGVALGVNRYVYASKWLRLTAAAMLTLAAFTWGKTQFAIPEWAGDVGDTDGTVADIS